MSAGMAALRAAVEPAALLFVLDESEPGMRFRVGPEAAWTWYEPSPQMRDVALTLWQLACQRGAARDVSHLAGAEAGPSAHRKRVARRLDHCTRRIADASQSLGTLLGSTLRTRLFNGRPVALLEPTGRLIETV